MREQQTIIDALDQESMCIFLEKGANKTDLKVQLHKLQNPEKNHFWKTMWQTQIFL